MSNAARSFGRTILVAFPVLAPALLLAACGQSADDQMADQVAAAKQAAERAEKAQKAAEQAARAVIAKTPPGTFGEDAASADFEDSDEPLSADPVDSASGMDVSADSDDSTSSIPR